MSCFLYGSSTFHDHDTPHPHLSATLCPEFSFKLPAVERDYMGIGLCLNQASPALNGLHNSQPINADYDLCGSHLKLAPPSSSIAEGSDNDSDADDEEPLSGNVGWPPISSYRKATTRSLPLKTSCHTEDPIETPLLVYPQAHPVGDNDNDEYNASHCDLGSRASSKLMIQPSQPNPRKSLHIKVSMDGTPIMRKLDLDSMQGYQHLSLELHKLFQFYKRNLSCEVGQGQSIKESSDANFVLTYKDKDGDWKLVGDKPWEIFARTARRLRIMKKAK